jgi:hypothetical protein
MPRSSHKKDKESDDDEPEPWNAVCIVGLRVYSKDEELDVMVFEEGFDEVAKPEELKDGDPGIDGDVEDFEEEETEKGGVAETPKDKVVVKEESNIGGKSKDAGGEETQRPVRANTD